MLDFLYQTIGRTPTILISISIMLFGGFLMTRITKLMKLPNVTAYIFTGIIIGPFVLNLVPEYVYKGMDFITDIALAFIAFNVGKFFKLETLKRGGKSVIIITLFESVVAAIFVFLGMYYIFHFSIAFSLILASIASATAPASTMMTIRQFNAKGDFVNTILQVVSLDDAVSLILFSVSVAIATAAETQAGFNFWIIAQPILYNLAIIILGFLWGIILRFFINTRRTTDNKLIITVSFILFFTGACAALNISPLLGCMVMGMTYINLTNDENLFRQVEQFSPPILSMFFILSGMRLDLTILAGLGIVGVVYFVVRILGKYTGATVGSLVTKSTENNIKYLGLALIPQAGVSIGLAALGARILPENYAQMLTTIIISSGVLYEIFGPASAKLSLFLTKSYEITPKPIKEKVQI